LENNNFPKALNFSRKDLSRQNHNIYHHIGIYCFKVSALERFVNLDQTKNEIENRLEQLRAKDNNMEINVALAKSSPIGIDTKEDYIALKKIMEYKS
jgi:3-deoxy-manno-octulosonate cytidylyltransferase (CMP-KDO synthetase)